MNSRTRSCRWSVNNSMRSAAETASPDATKKKPAPMSADLKKRASPMRQTRHVPPGVRETSQTTMGDLTATKLKEFINYDPDTGIFTRLARMSKSSRIQIGEIAGSINNHGYVLISILGGRYSAHRLAWLYMTGKWPINQIDHINTIKNDNRWNNLRQVTCSINKQNTRKANCDSSTGFLGAHPSGKKFRAQIRIDGKNIHLGLYSTPEDAHEAYIKAKRKLHIGNTL